MMEAGKYRLPYCRDHWLFISLLRNIARNSACISGIGGSARTGTCGGLSLSAHPPGPTPCLTPCASSSHARPPCDPHPRSYPVPPRPETQGRTETYIGNWMKARGCREKVGLGERGRGEQGCVGHVGGARRAMHARPGRSSHIGACV